MCSRVKMAGKLRGKTCMDWLKCLVENITNGQECKTKPNSTKNSGGAGEIDRRSK